MPFENRKGNDLTTKPKRLFFVFFGLFPYSTIVLSVTIRTIRTNRVIPADGNASVLFPESVNSAATTQVAEGASNPPA